MKKEIKRETRSKSDLCFTFSWASGNQNPMSLQSRCSFLKVMMGKLLFAVIAAQIVSITFHAKNKEGWENVLQEILR